MKLHITQEDIDKGIRRNPFSCPIAQALCRTFGYDNTSWHEPVSVAISGYIFFAGHEYLSNDGSIFAENFDEGKPVQSCHITLHMRNRSRIDGQAFQIVS